MKPVIKLKVPRAGAEAFTAGSSTHPDMRRWQPTHGSADSDLLPELDTIRARSRDLARNHGVAEGAVQTLTDNIVGSVVGLKSRPNWKMLGWDEGKSEDWSNEVEMLWYAYAEGTCIDAGHSLSFQGLTTQVYRSSFINGEALALPLWLPQPGEPATRLQIIEPDRISNPWSVPDTPNLRAGIEMDDYGAPIAYHILKFHPGDMLVRSAYGARFMPYQTERIPVRTPWGRLRVIHVHDKERTGQTRGKPGLASVLRQFKVLGDYANAELKAAVVNAMVALVTESSISQDGLVELLSSSPDALTQYTDGLAQRNRSAIDFNAGQVVPLMLGEKISSFSPARPSTAFEPFVSSLFLHIAAGLNIPYELLLKDFSKTNYSSARAALLEAWRFFRGRRKWLTATWAQPVFELWLEEQIMTGVIEAPDFYAKRAWYCRAKWIGDGRGWVDPLKEVQAAEQRMKIGVSTLETECAEQGEDWEEVLEQRARETQRANELGLLLPWMSGYDTTRESVSTTQGQQPNANPDGGQDVSNDGSSGQDTANDGSGNDNVITDNSKKAATYTGPPITIQAVLPTAGKILRSGRAVRGRDGTLNIEITETEQTKTVRTGRAHREPNGDMVFETEADE